MEIQTLKEELAAAAENCDVFATSYRKQLERTQQQVSELQTAVQHFETRATEYRALLAKLD